MTAVLAGFLLVLLHLKEEGLELFLKLAGYTLIAGGLTGFLKESVIFARARKGGSRTGGLRRHSVAWKPV